MKHPYIKCNLGQMSDAQLLTNWSQYRGMMSLQLEWLNILDHNGLILEFKNARIGLTGQPAILAQAMA